MEICQDMPRCALAAHSFHRQVPQQLETSLAPHNSPYTVKAGKHHWMVSMVMGYPFIAGWFHGKSIYKWMMTRGTLMTSEIRKPPFEWLFSVSDHFDSEEALESKGFGGSSAIPSLDVSLYEFPRALVVLVVFSCYFHIQFFSGLSVLSPLYAYSMIFPDLVLGLVLRWPKWTRKKSPRRIVTQFLGPARTGYTRDISWRHWCRYLFDVDAFLLIAVDVSDWRLSIYLSN